MKSFSFIVWQIKIPFYEIPVLGHSPFSIYKSTIRCYTEIIKQDWCADVNFICKIDRELYRVVEQELLTEEVIITEEQILHIEEGHPGDYGRLSAYISQVLQEPDYILRGNRPHTALVLKEISTPDLTAEIILRLKVSSDPEEYKNSIITMWSISQKRFRRLLRQSEILYKKG